MKKSTGLAAMKTPKPEDLDKFVQGAAKPTAVEPKGEVPIVPEKPPVEPVKPPQGGNGAAPIDPEEPTQRLTLEIPLSLHVAIKSGCALRRTKMKDEVLALLEAHYRAAA